MFSASFNVLPAELVALQQELKENKAKIILLQTRFEHLQSTLAAEKAIQKRAMEQAEDYKKQLEVGEKDEREEKEDKREKRVKERTKREEKTREKMERDTEEENRAKRTPARMSRENTHHNIMPLRLSFANFSLWYD